jgi:hypothetical protein
MYNTTSSPLHLSTTSSDTPRPNGMNNRMLSAARGLLLPWFLWAQCVVRRASQGEAESPDNVSLALLVLLKHGKRGYVASSSGDQVTRAMLVQLVERNYAGASKTLTTRLEKLFALLERRAQERGLDTTMSSELTKAALRSFGQGGAAHVSKLCTDLRDVSDYTVSLESPPPRLFGLFALTLWNTYSGGTYSCGSRRRDAMLAHAQDAARSFLERDGLAKWLTALKKLDTDSDLTYPHSPHSDSSCLWWLLSDLAHEEFVAKAKQNLPDVACTVAALAKSKSFKTVRALRKDLVELGNDTVVGAALATVAARDFNLGSKVWLNCDATTSLLRDVLTNITAAREAFRAALNDEEKQC